MVDNAPKSKQLNAGQNKTQMHKFKSIVSGGNESQCRLELGHASWVSSGSALDTPCSQPCAHRKRDGGRGEGEREIRNNRKELIS
jgi:hypothetical protein